MSRSGLLVAGSASLAVLLMGCEPVEVAQVIEEMDLPLETWDFSEGMLAEKANWGAEGWDTATEIADSQFKGPVHLRILLPGDRVIEGKFEIVRATRHGDLVGHVALGLPAMPAEKARDAALALVASADESVVWNNEALVRQWFEEGPVHGPGEELNLILSNPEKSAIEIGVNVNWLHSFADPAGRWNITVGMSNRARWVEDR